MRFACGGVTYSLCVATAGHSISFIARLRDA
jgi:hypothetical protein